MKAEDLRIGDLIFNGSLIIKVWMLVGKDVNGYDSEQEDFPFTPIPITEEWLLKLGFEKVNRVFYKNDFGYEFGFINRAVLKNGDNYILITHIEYIHQLQNLYFSLFNKELTIKDEN